MVKMGREVLFFYKVSLVWILAVIKGVFVFFFIQRLFTAIYEHHLFIFLDVTPKDSGHQ